MTVQRLITVDGPAGSGKTTFTDVLARSLSAELGGTAHVMHMDDLYEGWTGLDSRLTERLEAWVTAPLRNGGQPRYRRYDWHLGSYGDWVGVPATDWLILEGVGSGQAVVREVAVFGVWVEAPPRVRLARGLARDGPQLRDEWLAWQIRETAHFEADATRAHCDAIVNT